MPRVEVCDDCGYRTLAHKYVAGQYICTYCYAERDEAGRMGQGLPWVQRPDTPVAPCWRGYHLACEDVGYSLRAAPTRTLRDRIHERWSHYLYLGAVLRDDDHYGIEVYEGPEWEGARELAGQLSAGDVARIMGG